MDMAIEVAGLAKRFGAVRALDGLDLRVAAGEVHGLLGPNGAGKTTTIRVLLGLLRADEGHAGILGGDAWRDAVPLHRRLAYVPGDVHLWPNLTGGEVIDLMGRLRGRTAQARRDELVERFGLDPTKHCRTYSKGNRQKVALVAALAADVDLYLLDEPSSGLDPLMAGVFVDVVRELRDAGRTVLLSSHVLAEVEALADRLTIVRAGRAVESGTFDELRHLTRTSVQVRTGRPLDGLAGWPGVHDVVADRGTTTFAVDTAAMGDVMRRLAEHHVQSLVCAPPTLEELFRSRYDEHGHDEAAGAEREPVLTGGAR
jgi:ABC-2 type transport system ATP-binding protein